MSQPTDNRILWSGESISAAERMLALAESVKKPAGVVILIDGHNMQPETLSRVRTALELAKLPAVTRMRAILEDWDMNRIIREVY